MRDKKDDAVAKLAREAGCDCFSEGFIAPDGDNGGWEFNLGDEVEIIVSGEIGVVVGRAEYLNSADAYYVRYQASNGRAVESWWAGDALDYPDDSDDCCCATVH